MKKVNIGLKPETHKKAKIISTLKGVTLSRYLEKAIEDAVKKDEGVLRDIKE